MQEADYYVKLLANKIKAFADLRNKTDRSDRRLRAADVHYNLSAIVYGIVNHLYRDPLTISFLESIIEDHNTKAGRSDNLYLLMERGWIRVINDKPFIPAVISAYIGEVKNGKHRNALVPGGPDFHQIDALLLLEQAIVGHQPYLIDPQTVENIIAECHSKILLNELIEMRILSKDDTGDLRYIFSGPYDPEFDDRILSLAWTNMVGTDTAHEKFRRFFRFVELSNCWPQSLSFYARHDQVDEVIEFARNELMTCTDLARPELEVRNDKYDANRFGYRVGLPEIPEYSFTQSRPFNFLMELRNFRFYDRELFSYREHDSFYHLLIRMILFHDKESLNYPVTRDILKNSVNPYVRWEILYMIKSESPWILAFFLKDNALASLTFHFLDELTVHGSWIVSEFGWDVSLAMSDKIRKELWNEAFELFLDLTANSSEVLDLATPIAEIIHELAEKTFHFSATNYERNVESHQIYRERYESVIKRLGLVRLRNSAYHYGEQLPLLIGKILPELHEALNAVLPAAQVNDLLSLKTDWIDLRIELLKYLQNDFTNKELYERGDDALPRLSGKIITEITGYLKWYFSVTAIEVHHYFGKPDIKPPHRFDHFGLEIIDWPVYLNLLHAQGELTTFEEEFYATIYIDPIDNRRRNDHNTEELFKISIFVKIILSAYISVRVQQTQSLSFPVSYGGLTDGLERIIIKYALRFNFDDATNGRLDLFSNRNFFYRDGPYAYSMVSRLYRAVNYFSLEKTTDFVARFFSDDESYDKLLRAYNRVDNKSVKSLIAEKIKAQDEVAFINNSSYDEIQSALAELANSDALFQLAEPFLLVLENRAKKKGEFQFDLQRALFTIKLLLALKNKRLDDLQSLQPPASPYHQNRPTQEDIHEKQYYLALYYCDNERRFEESENILVALTHQEPENVKFAFNLYRVRTLNGKSETAKQEWDNFQKTNSEKIRSERVTYDELSQSLDIVYYIEKKEWLMFDQVVNTLSATFLYQDFLIILIYNAYLERDMAEAAFLFIREGVAFLEANRIPVSAELNKLEMESFDDRQLRKIGTVLLGLRSMPPEKIPLIAPPLLNDQRQFQEFMLKEFFQAAKIMREKIKAVESIRHEDNFNDVLLAILRMRIPIWGWEATDQSRSGTSASRQSAGEIDLLIQGGGQSLALVEALKLGGSNITTLQPHVLKCAGYNQDLNFFIVISYYIGDRNTWPSFKDLYIQDLRDIAYPADQALLTTTSIQELTENFAGISNMEILKTVHGPKNRVIFHLLIDVSKEPKLPAVPKRPKGKRQPKATNSTAP